MFFVPVVINVFVFCFSVKKRVVFFIDGLFTCVKRCVLETWGLKRFVCLKKWRGVGVGNYMS